MILQSTTNFVISQWSIQLTLEQRERIYKYDNFLKQQLNKGMFVPCDLNGNVLEEPKTEYEPISFWNACEVDEKYNDLISEYEQAKERVLFKGFEINKNGVLRYCETWNFDINLFINKNIEFLASFFSELELTESAIKQFM